MLARSRDRLAEARFLPPFATREPPPLDTKSGVSHSKVRGAAFLALACGALACTGEIGAPHGTGPDSFGPSIPGSRPPDGYDPKTLDPGHVPVHRLNNTEYNNTVRDLLGTSLQPGDYIEANTVTGFDTNAQALAGITKSHAQAYFEAAKALAADVFANASLKSKILTCQAPAAGDAACATTIIQNFGRQAWRRALEPAEVAALASRYSEALAMLGKDHEGAIAHVLRIMLTAAPFLYRIEIDPDLQAAARDGRALGGPELASRLSYLIWSSLPDATLSGLADNGDLTNTGALTAEVDRLLDDPKGTRFLDTFMNQWLGIRELEGHQVDADLYPLWSDELRQGMFADASAFFSKFLQGGRPWSEFLLAPLDAGIPALSPIYAGDPPGSRGGFLGLPAFLTARSMPTRTAPTFRGKIVLDALLCTTIELPPNLMIPELAEAGGDSVDPANIRAKLELHRSSPDCASCHRILDPIGLGLESFDAIGRYRTSYENGDQVSPAGEFNDEPFNGLYELVQILSKDPLFASCPSTKILAFALRRTPRAEDQPYIDQLTTDWSSGSLRDLIKGLVSSDAFRFRKLPESAL